ncbi:hypothetical protein CCP3SC1AL1_350007 [Gammaproteobacteria bacterium]
MSSASSISLADLQAIYAKAGTQTATANDLVNLISSIPATEIDALEMLFKTVQIASYKQFVYTGDDLTTLNVWSDNTMLTKLFQADYTYTSGNLTEIYVERISDGANYTKTLSYDSSDNLTFIETI